MSQFFLNSSHDFVDVIGEALVAIRCPKVAALTQRMSYDYSVFRALPHARPRCRGQSEGGAHPTLSRW